ncbi:MAG: helix-turn-helix domain-containing protein [Eubacteriales bacterium]|nr:helix-turn-helix domain-containing protein [Eubacteriales bacterium]
MNYIIKELRLKTGLTQVEFAQRFDIPVSTLRKWEQSESTPPAYVIKLIASLIPGTNNELKVFKSSSRAVYYYDPVKKLLYDQIGNSIFVNESLEGVNEENLSIYINRLFEDFYSIQKKFNDDLKYDKEEDILWS